MIRAASQKDSVGIAQVHVDSWRATYKGLVPDDHLSGLSVPDRAERWKERFVKTKGIVFVAEHGGETIAFADFGPNRDKDKTPSITSELYAMYVRPESLGGGLGRQLFEHGLAWAREAHFQELTTLVLDTNLNARRFYEKMGMTPDGFILSAQIGGQNVSELRYAMKL